MLIYHTILLTLVLASPITLTTNFLKLHHVIYINGPILFTSPHGKTVMREDGNNSFQQHNRQKYVSWISVQLASKMNITSKTQINSPYSFCTWGNTMLSIQDLDSNYLRKSMFRNSQFHLCLHRFVSKNPNLPLLHVDIHGKLNRQQCLVEVGIKSIEVYWGKNNTLLSGLSQFFTQFSSIFQGTILSHCAFTTDGKFQGYQEKGLPSQPDYYTMTQQAILLGIPSLQLEIPFQVRKQLFYNETFSTQFSKGLEKLYNQVIVPYFPSQNATFIPEYSDRLIVTVPDRKRVKEAKIQLRYLDT